MKRSIVATVLLGLVLLLAACASTSNEEAGAGSEVEKMSASAAMADLVKRWDTALNSGEVNAVTALYTTDFPVAMPPDLPTSTGQEELNALFGGMFAAGSLEVTNREARVLEGNDLVIAHGTYTLNRADESGAETREDGKWTCVARRKDDGSLVALRNIWNRDAMPPGAPALPAMTAAAPPAAEEAACPQSPKLADDAFVEAFTSGDISEAVALHSKQASRMAPGMPVLEGRDAIGAFLQSFADNYATRKLELSNQGEMVDGNLGYSWGNYSFNYSGGKTGAIEGVGKFVSVSHKDADGCWRAEWVIWNRDAPLPVPGA